MKTSFYRDIVKTAAPVYIGQMASIAYMFLDTVMVGRYSSFDLGVMALATSIYFSIFFFLNGVLMAISPVVSGLLGKRDLPGIGQQIIQSGLLLVLCSLIGAVVLCNPGPILMLSDADKALQQDTVTCLRMMALTLPFGLFVFLHTTILTAIGEPGRAMFIRVAGLLLKIPLNYVLIFGTAAALPHGAVGCALATLLDMAVLCLAAVVFSIRRGDAARFSIRLAQVRPDKASILHLLRVGLPIGVGYLVEVSAYTMMAVFIARFGTTMLAAHQIVSNIGSITYMMPMSVGLATSTLAARLLGEGRPEAARELSRSGLKLAMACAVASALLLAGLRDQIAALYTEEQAVRLYAASLMLTIMVYHLFDAAQVCIAFILRAYQITFKPMLIYIACLWGVGLAGGYQLAFGKVPDVAWLKSANGFWLAATASLCLASVAFYGVFQAISRKTPPNQLVTKSH